MRWRATVVRDGRRLRWEGFDIPRSELAERVFGLDSLVRAGVLWSRATAPDIDMMNARSQQAILGGHSTYEQDFRVVRDGRLFWVHEKVAVEPIDADRWDVSGVVIDITADRESQTIQTASEEELQQILKVADCLLWRARVFQRRSEIDADWVLYIPRSSLYRKLFGCDPPDHPTELWNSQMVPELPEMNDRSSAAILRGDTEYEHEFCVHLGNRVLTMHEHVSIEYKVPGEWSLTGILMDVTAAHEAEEARRQSEARIQQILARADCMIWQARVAQLDPEFTDLKWNVYLPRSELVQRIFNLAPEETPALDWKKLKVPEYRAMAANARAALRAGDPSYEHEFHVPREKEPPVWLREQVSIRPAGPGQWDLIGFVTDISAARAAEEARRKSEAQLHQTLTAADCLIWQANVTREASGDFNWDLYAQGSVLYTKLFGENPVYSKDGRLTLNWYALNVPEVAEMDAKYKEAIQHGLPGYDHEFRAHVRSRTYWLREQVSIKALGGGRYDLVGVITDISERRKAEQALADEKERLAVTLRAMAEGVITTDTTGSVLFMNPAAALLTGFEATAAVGRPITEVCALVSQRSGEPVSVSGKLVVSGDRVADLPAQTLLVGKNGMRRSVEGCFAPIHSADSKVIGSVLVFRDVTERERLEQELVRSSRLESVGILAGGIAHDYNNILTAIMGNLSMAMLDAEGESELAKCLKEAERATRSARDLTQQLLTFAKGGEPVRSAVDLSEIVREMADFALHGSLVKSIFDLPADLWPVDADKGQIGRVVQNLVINAFQAMPDGGIVRISARNEEITGIGRPSLVPGDYVHISIADAGVGINSDILARIFDPYFTTKKSGSGLGLAVAYSIVTKHRGLIDVESQAGHGTTFHIWLPALRGVQAAAEVESSGPLKSLTGRVLFMDDEEGIRTMASALLKRIGLDFVTVPDGREAVEQFSLARAEGRPFSLVVMDLTIPGGMGGRETLKLLREIDPGVKAIVSSGYSSDPVLANFRDYGFCGVVSKPYEAHKFCIVIGEILNSTPPQAR
jgi:PAS domain S-box-containing protein